MAAQVQVVLAELPVWDDLSGVPGGWILEGGGKEINGGATLLESWRVDGYTAKTLARSNS
jgi:hypothetical protein